MPHNTIDKSTIQFLKKLKKNNTREWFHDNKASYKQAHDNFKSVIADVETEMNKIDVIEKVKHFRIYRDVRFSKDKTPYNTHFSASISREGAHRRGGYYLRISTEGHFIVGGFWNPEPKDMKLIRGHIAAEPNRLRKVLKSKTFTNYFGELHGEQVKTAPKGFSKDDKAIDLLRYKQLLAHKQIKEGDVVAANYVKEVVKTFKAMHPFFNYMTDILTHDLDGIPLYE